MKQFAFFLLTLIMFSCSTSEESSQDYLEILPIETAILPEEFELGETYEITVDYLLPTNCHAFNDIYYLSEQHERTIAIVSHVFVNQPCDSAMIDVQASFNFKATESGSYIFKFWQGENEAGDDEYLIIEVPVIE